MNVHQIPVGAMQNFSYIVEDEETSDTIVIDPSWDLDVLYNIIQKHSLHVVYTVNTHHHFDHTLGNEAFCKTIKSKIIQHVESKLKHDIAIHHGDHITFGNSKLRVLHTPGHSRDSICLVGDGKIFSGDTLFVGSCGRVDLEGGSAHELYHSLFETLSVVDNDTVVYPGHHYGRTPTSTMGNERITNPVLQAKSEDQFVGIFG